MAGWGEFGAAVALFLLSHAVPTQPRFRRPLVTAIGEHAYLIGYSLASVAVLAWLVAAAGRAPFLLLRPQAAWQAWLANVAMPLVCLLVAFQHRGEDD